MQLSDRSITAIQKAITGDCDLFPYRTGGKLVGFFNKYGSKNTYQQGGFPSRRLFTEEELKKYNCSPTMKKIIEDALHPLDFIEAKKDIQKAIEYLNPVLAYDSLKLCLAGTLVKITPLNATMISNDFLINPTWEQISAEFIQEQVEKCKNKLLSQDYDGAITNARSLLEATLVALIGSLSSETYKFDGDLGKLFKEARERLNLSVEGTNMPKEIKEPLSQMLSGLNNVVNGLAGISNKMGDRHSRKYPPKKHHAELVVNTTYTLCNFLLSSMEYQYAKTRKGLNNAD
jgi:hypothetical protein